MKKFLTFLLTAALLASASVSVFADEVVDGDAPDAAQGEVLGISLDEELPGVTPLILEGRTQVRVTSSITSLGIETSNFFDSNPGTKCKIAFDDAAEGGNTLSIYTATRIPEALSDFAVILSGEPETIVTVEAYATNDSLLLDWEPLTFEPESLDTEYAIFSMEDNETRYAFYRFDFILEQGSYFEIAELALFKVTVEGEVELQYDLGYDVEAGVMPELIPVVKAEEAEEEVTVEVEDAVEAEEPEEVVRGRGMSKTPTFGLLTSYPMPRWKFLPRG